ncbi:PilN domain-containing protein [Oryzomonas sagensis]|uniref:PilN domain-containing protein n=1 Tax=Oryzomonas sagensis TaxID=2603857 RepID=A0ABQ6TLQ3_9BACT|nr:PilN domain-containing protein [Oryzomonas sagensis]KAB0669385.1 PilN domain-containing protein [Oryzomonas sagensis]
MIKINLLPVRAAKKKETAVQQISIFCVSLLLVAVIVVSLYIVKRMQIASAQADITTANEKIGALKKRIGKLEELKTLKDQVKKKLDVLAQLRKNKTGPAERLSTLSDVTPEQLWLTGYTENGADIKLSGIAYTEELIASFMRSLEASRDYMGVELVVSEQMELGGTKLKKFELTCKLKAAAPPQPAAAPKK